MFAIDNQYLDSEAFPQVLEDYYLLIDYLSQIDAD